MITEGKKSTTIDIDEDTLVKSIAMMMDLIDFCKGLYGETGKSELLSTLQCAYETMMAFACEHFTEDGKRDCAGREDGDAEKLRG
mgnify:CR=1 FL=1